MDYISKQTADGKVVRVKNYKKRIKKNRRRRKIFLFLLLLISVTLFANFAPIFSIKNITYSGNSKVIDKQIFAVSTITMGYNIFRTDIHKAENLIKTIPYIKTASIKRKFPNILSITVTESEVACYFAFNGKYAYIDKDGKMLELSERPPDIDIPIVENLDVKKFEAGKTINNTGKLALLTTLMDELAKAKIVNDVNVITIPTIHNASMLYNNQLEVLIGDNAELDYKINFLLKNTLIKLGNNAKGFLDISNTNTGAIYRENK